MAANDCPLATKKMLSRFFKTKLQWRRVAVYQPVAVEGVSLSNEDGSDRQSILRACQVEMRVFLQREPNLHDPDAVSVFVTDETRIGQLPAEVAEWIAPLLDSGKSAFDAQIWSLEKVEGENGRELITCSLMLTQHQLVAIRQLSLIAWLRRAKHFRSPVRISSAPPTDR
jgi:hypothetical protein